MEYQLQPIAHMHTDFATKFGVPRQSGLVSELTGRIVFEPAYRQADALRGLEGFSHLWVVWWFHMLPSASAPAGEDGAARTWRPMVRPPRLGGNVRRGVFATRSPFRPNPIGLSAVRIERIDLVTDEGPVIWVKGADLVDGTPILDIKPYLPFVDAIADANGGFAEQTREQPPLGVDLPAGIRQALAEVWPDAATRLSALVQVLAQDPRPHYQEEPTRIYGLTFAGCEIRFRVEAGVAHVVSAARASDDGTD